MTTSLRDTQLRRNCIKALSGILDRCPPKVDTTLIAVVDRVTLEVLAVHQLPTPAPQFVTDAEGRHCFSEASLSHLTGELRLVASTLIPAIEQVAQAERQRFDLVTVVCRDGEPALTDVETQLHHAWRFVALPGHARQGELVALTARGCAGIYGRWVDVTPRLSVTLPADQQGAQALLEVESILGEAAQTLAQVGDEECLACYLVRMTEVFGCNGTLRYAREFRKARAPRATALERRLRSGGGFCDCEVLLNVYAPRPPAGVSLTWHDGFVEELFDDDVSFGDGAAMPPCRGARRGSTQPCHLWTDRVIGYS